MELWEFYYNHNQTLKHAAGAAEVEKHCVVFLLYLYTLSKSTPLSLLPRQLSLRWRVTCALIRHSLREEPRCHNGVRDFWRSGKWDCRGGKIVSRLATLGRRFMLTYYTTRLKLSY